MISWRLGKCHRLIQPSRVPTANVRPSGEKARESTGPEPLAKSSKVWLDISQSLTWVSIDLPVTSQRLSVENTWCSAVKSSPGLHRTVSQSRIERIPYCELGSYLVRKVLPFGEKA